MTDSANVPDLEQSTTATERLSLLKFRLREQYQSLGLIAEALLLNELFKYSHPELRNDFLLEVAATRLLEPYPLIVDAAKFRILNGIARGLPKAA